MNTKIMHFKKYLLLLLLICLSGATLAAAADDAEEFKGAIIDPETVKPLQINGLVMEVNTLESYLVVSEKRFDVTQYRLANEKEVHKTALTGLHGDSVGLEFFKENQRVLVTGWQIANGRIVASKVERLKDMKRK
jgi:hypothetical protein